LGKYLWVLDMAVIALCGAQLGLAASGLVASRFPPVAYRPRTPRLPGATAAPIKSKRPDAILRRNIFCSTCPPIRLEGDPDPALAEESANPESQPTGLPLKLVAVMFSPEPRRQRWNLAVVRDKDRGNIGAFSVGAKIDGATLVSILDRRIYLDHAGASEYVDLLAAAKPSPPAAMPPIKAPRPPVDPFAAELERGIKKLGDRRYEIQRSTLEAVMGNLALLTRSARIVPDVRGGKPYGFRLFAVRPDGPFAKIGLQNNDVVVSINGLEMNSPEKALEVYGKLKSASHVSLGLERGGKKAEQDYTIR
jgi:general secretion pathway protein C